MGFEMPYHAADFHGNLYMQTEHVSVSRQAGQQATCTSFTPDGRQCFVLDTAPCSTGLGDVCLAAFAMVTLVGVLELILAKGCLCVLVFPIPMYAILFCLLRLQIRASLSSSSAWCCASECTGSVRSCIATMLLHCCTSCTKWSSCCMETPVVLVVRCLLAAAWLCIECAVLKASSTRMCTAVLSCEAWYSTATEVLLCGESKSASEGEKPISCSHASSPSLRSASMLASCDAASVWWLCMSGEAFGWGLLLLS